MAKKKAVATKIEAPVEAPVKEKREKFAASMKLESNLIFKSLDPAEAHFAVEERELGLSGMSLSPGGIFPEGFDPKTYKVTGKVFVEIEVKER